tara:strand:- start:19799 stop:21721 length:1923 start_codon:yes stop_codon:yes gene_type:complete
MSDHERKRLGFLNPIAGGFEQFIEGVRDTGVMFQQTLENIRRGQELNIFRGTHSYKAIIISTPKLIRSKDPSDVLDKNHYQFRARIPEIHAGIPDPFCFMEAGGTAHSSNQSSGTESEASRHRAKHPLFVSDNSATESADGLDIGDIVLVSYKKGPGSSRGIGGRFLSKTREAKYSGYEKDCADMVNKQPPDWCGLCPGAAGDPSSCYPNAGGSGDTYEGAPAVLSDGYGSTPYKSGHSVAAGAVSGPCAKLWYEDKHGLGVGKPQVSPCCCGQTIKWGAAYDPDANTTCPESRGCHSLVLKSSSKDAGGADYSVVDRYAKGEGGILNCSTGAYIRYEVSPASLNTLVKPLWLAFIAEVKRVVGGGIGFSYTSVRRSVKHQWILYTGRQGMGPRSGIYFPSKPMGAKTVTGHRAGAACDGKWTIANESALNPGWSGLSYLQLCEKINTEIAGNRSPSKFGIGWFGHGDDIHWEMYYASIDPDTGKGVAPGQGGTMTKLSSRSLGLAAIGEAAWNYYFGLHGSNSCNWHEDLVDLPLEFLVDMCPNGELKCLAQLGDPSTYDPTVIRSGIVSEETLSASIFGVDSSAAQQMTDLDLAAIEQDLGIAAAPGSEYLDLAVFDDEEDFQWEDPYDSQAGPLAVR